MGKKGLFSERGTLISGVVRFGFGMDKEIWNVSNKYIILITNIKVILLFFAMRGIISL